MTKINTLSLRGIDIDIFYNNGFIAYSFMKDGKSYGQKVKLPSKKVIDISASTFLLFENALETYESLTKTNENK